MAQIHKTTFTSESVCAGHPDKICDQISDAIVDAALATDPKARVAVETLATQNHVTLAGEVSLNGQLNYQQIARREIKRLGYNQSIYNFDHTSPINVLIHEQSPEIAQGVDVDGAGDQGMMFGYACNESQELMPLPIVIAHKLARTLDEAKESGTLAYLRPDGKTQVTVGYRNGQPVSIDDVVIAVPHSETVAREQVESDVWTKIVIPTLATFGLDFKSTHFILNGTGAWHIGGPASDTGVTGRKIVVDTYGGYARVGGGAFSGKDPTKVDRSGAYAARYLAKNIVAQGLAERAEVRLAYFIGAKMPLMHEIETFSTAKVSNKAINDFCLKLLDTSVRGILEHFDLRRPIYLPTAAYGHFGRPEFPWEHVAKD